MNTKKSWKPLISILGLILIMMTAASVSAEDPLIRESQAPDDTGMIDTIDDTEGTVEPLLIATGEAEENITSDLPDYENYTGDMLISPGPEANSAAQAPFNLPLVGLIGAVIVVLVVMSGIIIKRKNQ